MRTDDPWVDLALTKAAADTMRSAEYIEGIGTYQVDGGISAISTELCESLSLAACRRRWGPFRLFVRCCDRWPKGQGRNGKASIPVIRVNFAGLIFRETSVLLS